MIVFVIYVGDNNEYIVNFSKLLNNELEVISDLSQLSEISKKNRNSLPFMVLLQSSTSEVDIFNIKFIRRELPYAYIVLISSIGDNVKVSSYLEAGLNDTFLPNVTETRIRNVLDFITQNNILFAGSFQQNLHLGVYTIPVWKRIFDVLISVSAIIVLMPFLFFIALLIRIESPGPIIYKSKRVGSNYKVFDFYKFRSMYRDADKRLKDFLRLNQYKDVDPVFYDSSNDIAHIPILESDSYDNLNISDNSYISDDEVISEEEFLKEKNKRRQNNFVKLENDPRITKIGRFIRKYSIDEIPQLINILKGEMSIVGNRPLPLYEAEQLTSDKYIDRFLGPAGLTGLWQVEKRGDSGRLSPEERKQLDIYYAKNFNFWMDLKIVIKTFSSFVQKENV